jgi:hypothetical protein
MAVLPEEKIVASLARCLALSTALLPILLPHGTAPADGRHLADFQAFIDDLAREREKDAYLSDESWDWIWKGKPSYNYLQLYGRLALINLQLFDLL